MSLEQQLSPLGLNFPLPSEAGFRLDLSERKMRFILLGGLNHVASMLGKGASTTPVPSSKTVTASVSAISDATETSRRVSVFNNGENEILILPGANPAFANGTTQMVDFGIKLASGGYWESPAPITGAVNAIAKTGEQSAVTVVNFA